MLSARQIEQFHTNGYIFGLPLMPADKAALICRHLRRRATAERLLRALVLDARVLEAVGALIGPDILIRNADVFVKTPQSPLIISWHIDTISPPEAAAGLLNAWIALTPATPENGCLQYLPGCHRSMLPVEPIDNKHLTLSPESRAALDLESAVHAEMRAGELALHAYRTPHSSGPNRTDHPRIGLAIRFMSARMRPEDAECGQAFLASGQAHGWSLRPSFPIEWSIKHAT